MEGRGAEFRVAPPCRVCGCTLRYIKGHDCKDCRAVRQTERWERRKAEAAAQGRPKGTHLLTSTEGAICACGKPVVPGKWFCSDVCADIPVWRAAVIMIEQGIYPGGHHGNGRHYNKRRSLGR